MIIVQIVSILLDLLVLLITFRSLEYIKRWPQGQLTPNLEQNANKRNSHSGDAIIIPANVKGVVGLTVRGPDQDRDPEPGALSTRYALQPAHELEDNMLTPVAPPRRHPEGDIQSISAYQPSRVSQNPFRPESTDVYRDDTSNISYPIDPKYAGHSPYSQRNVPTLTSQMAMEEQFRQRNGQGQYTNPGFLGDTLSQGETVSLVSTPSRGVYREQGINDEPFRNPFGKGEQQIRIGHSLSEEEIESRTSFHVEESNPKKLPPSEFGQNAISPFGDGSSGVQFRQISIDSRSEIRGGIGAGVEFGTASGIGIGPGVGMGPGVGLGAGPMPGLGSRPASSIAVSNSSSRVPSPPPYSPPKFMEDKKQPLFETSDYVIPNRVTYNESDEETESENQVSEIEHDVEIQKSRLETEVQVQRSENYTGVQFEKSEVETEIRKYEIQTKIETYGSETEYRTGIQKIEVEAEHHTQRFEYETEIQKSEIETYGSETEFRAEAQKVEYEIETYKPETPIVNQPPKPEIGYGTEVQGAEFESEKQKLAYSDDFYSQTLEYKDETYKSEVSVRSQALVSEAEYGSKVQTFETETEYRTEAQKVEFNTEIQTRQSEYRAEPQPPKPEVGYGTGFQRLKLETESEEQKLAYSDDFYSQTLEYKSETYKPEAPIRNQPPKPEIGYGTETQIIETETEQVTEAQKLEFEAEVQTYQSEYKGEFQPPKPEVGYGTEAQGIEFESGKQKLAYNDDSYSQALEYESETYKPEVPVRSQALVSETEYKSEIETNSSGTEYKIGLQKLEYDTVFQSEKSESNTVFQSEKSEYDTETQKPEVLSRIQTYKSEYETEVQKSEYEKDIHSPKLEYETEIQTYQSRYKTSQPHISETGYKTEMQAAELKSDIHSQKLEYEKTIQKSKYDTVFQSEKLAYDTVFQPEKSTYDAVFQSEKSEYGTVFQPEKSTYDTVFQSEKSEYDTVFQSGYVNVSQSKKSAYDTVFQSEKSNYDTVFQSEKSEHENIIRKVEVDTGIKTHRSETGFETEIQKSVTEEKIVDLDSLMDETVSYWSNGRTNIQKSKKVTDDFEPLPPTPMSLPPVSRSVMTSETFEETEVRRHQDASEKIGFIVVDEKETRTEISSDTNRFRTNDYTTTMNMQTVKNEDKIGKRKIASRISITSSKSGYSGTSESEDSTSSESSTSSSKKNVEHCSSSSECRDEHHHGSSHEYHYEKFEDSCHSDSSEESDSKEIWTSEKETTTRNVSNLSGSIVKKETVQEFHTSPTVQSADYMKKYEYSFSTLAEVPSSSAPKVSRPISLMTEIPLKPSLPLHSNRSSVSSMESKIAFNQNYRV